MRDKRRAPARPVDRCAGASAVRPRSRMLVRVRAGRLAAWASRLRRRARSAAPDQAAVGTSRRVAGIDDREQRAVGAERDIGFVRALLPGRQAQAGNGRGEPGEGDPRLQPGQCGADAEMRAVAEGQVIAAVRPVWIEPVRVGERRGSRLAAPISSRQRAPAGMVTSPSVTSRLVTRSQPSMAGAKRRVSPTNAGTAPGRSASPASAAGSDRAWSQARGRATRRWSRGRRPGG